MDLTKLSSDNPRLAGLIEDAAKAVDMAYQAGQNDEAQRRLDPQPVGDIKDLLDAVELDEYGNDCHFSNVTAMKPLRKAVATLQADITRLESEKEVLAQIIMSKDEKLAELRAMKDVEQ